MPKPKDQKKKKKSKGRSDADYCYVEPVFQDQDVFILGGGPSLKNFDFTQLENKNVIGCNDNYLLNETYGKQIVDILYFGDQSWWSQYHGKGDTVSKNGKDFKSARHFNGPVYCSANNFIKDEKVCMLRRASSTLRSTPRIGWFQSTGASAINLALQLGARRIILLGYDMKHTGKNAHNYFQNLKNPKVSDSAIDKHKSGIHKLSTKMKNSEWAPVPVLNANPDSGLDCFQKIKPEKIIRQSADKGEKSPVADEVNEKLKAVKKDDSQKQDETNQKVEEPKPEAKAKTKKPKKNKPKNKNNKPEVTSVNAPKETPSKLNVCCLAWSGERNWNNQYLNTKYITALYNGVKENYSYPFDFYAFVDEKNCKVCKGYIPEEINLHTFDSPSWKGCLPKLYVYSDQVPFTEGRVIVMDLDTIITGSLDDIFSYSGEFATREAFRKAGCSGGDMIGFPVDHNMKWAWDKLSNDSEEIENNTGGSERFFYRNYCNHIDFWQRMFPNQYLSYKNHLKDTDEKPEGCRLVSCHGKPGPHQIPDSHWLKSYWKPEKQK